MLLMVMLILYDMKTMIIPEQEVRQNHPFPIQSGFRQVLEQKMAKIRLRQWDA